MGLDETATMWRAPTRILTIDGGAWRMSMSIKGTDPILGPCRGDPNAFFAVLVGPDQKDHDYVFAVHHWASVAGVDDALVYDQFSLETTEPGSNSPGTSVRWNRDLNPADSLAPTPSRQNVSDGRWRHTELSGQRVLRHRSSKAADFGHFLPIEFRCPLEPGVIGEAQWAHVVGVDAGAVRPMRATVIRNHAFRQRPEALFVIETMRSPLTALVPLASVSIFVKRELPNPAARNGVDLVRFVRMLPLCLVVSDKETHRLPTNPSTSFVSHRSQVRQMPTTAGATNRCVRFSTAHRSFLVTNRAARKAHLV